MEVVLVGRVGERLEAEEVGVDMGEDMEGEGDMGRRGRRGR